MIKYISSNKGQTLIEVIAAIAVGTIIITALLSLAARSNRNANFARTSAQATKLAQQGLEIIRNIDSVNSVQNGGSIRNLNGTCGPNCSWVDLYGETFNTPADPYNFVLVRLNTFECLGITDSWCLKYGSVGTPPVREPINVDLGNFTREVRIEDDRSNVDNPCNGEVISNGLGPGESKLITVTVRWDDPSGAQDVDVSTCISNL